ncbi:DNA/RNA nuclease SfsA [candidate division KSB1 bacterium]|nr:DNA/RNA nuclease SfsA [candidate division KSB1 bacterium]
MTLPEPLIPGKLIQRYKRFLADIELETGEIITAHCANPGSMMGLLQIGSQALVSKSQNPKRKLPFSWELIKIGRTWVVVNTANTNRVIHEALLKNQIPELLGYSEIKPEAVWGDHTRFDFLLHKEHEKCFVEVKNVTLAKNDIALFPDSVTKRGTKHLNGLMQVIREGDRAVMCFLVSREDCRFFKPAADIDPVYAETLREAYENHVEILVYQAKVSPPQITLDCPLKFKV